MQADELTAEEIHILYCLHILRLSPEKTAERVWANSSPIMADFYPMYVAWVFENDRRMRARGQLPPFSKEDFLEEIGFPSETVRYLH